MRHFNRNRIDAFNFFCHTLRRVLISYQKPLVLEPNDKLRENMKKFWLILFYGFANQLPNSYTMIVGKICNRIRIAICRHIFKECGNVSTINRKIYFGKGEDIVIGDDSGIGANCVLTDDIVIGKYVMMGPELYCIKPDHRTDDINTPMCFQGHAESRGGER